MEVLYSPQKHRAKLWRNAAVRTESRQVGPRTAQPPSPSSSQKVLKNESAAQHTYDIGYNKWNNLDENQIIIEDQTNLTPAHLISNTSSIISEVSFNTFFLLYFIFYIFYFISLNWKGKDIKTSWSCNSSRYWTIWKRKREYRI